MRKVFNNSKLTNITSEYLLSSERNQSVLSRKASKKIVNFAGMKHYTIPIFVPELACPHRCIFCNQNKISSTLEIPEIGECRKIIEEHLTTIPSDSFVEIGFFGGSFTGIPEREQRGYLKIAYEYKKAGKIKGIRLSTRPDYIDSEKLLLLKEYGVTTVELGAQSMSEDVLKASGRGHDVAAVENAAKMVREAGFFLGLQMMLGLPGDTKEKSLRTAKRIVELGADNTRIYPTLVVKDTPLEKLWREKKYFPLSIEEAINWTKDIIPIFEKGDVNIIRVGLHPSEGFLSGEDLVDGPFHPSFKEFVLTEMWHDKLQNIIPEKDKKEIAIHVFPKEYNAAIGYRAKNRKMLLEKFSKVKFVADKNIVKGDFYVDYC
ncbi:MAG: radical SAM protein [Bacteroidota bacterium]|nr:radical SAM protein [Bacteroidota bacterium]